MLFSIAGKKLYLALIFVCFIPSVCVSAQSKGPFFWQIENEGKQSYILGTKHSGVSFEDLQCHGEIKTKLGEADLLLSELPFDDEDRSQEVSYREELHEQFMFGDGFENLSPHYQEMILAKLGNNQELVTNSSYFFLYELLKKLCRNLPIERVELLSKRQIEPDKISSRKNSYMYVQELLMRGFEFLQMLDVQVIDYFKSLKGDEFFEQVVSLDGNKEDRENLLTVYSYLSETVSKKDVEDWIDNFDERCQSKVEFKPSAHEHPKETRKTRVQSYITGEFNTEDGFRNRYGRDSGFLESEVRQHLLYTIGYALDYRNQQWRTKIVEAHKTNNSIFIAGGTSHFIAQDRNPLNMPELTEYAHANKDLPTNVLVMLEQEGFKIKRMSSNCSFE